MDPASSSGAARSAADATLATRPAPLEPLHVNMIRLTLIGTAIWAVALVLSLAVPALHHGSRDWWPWAALAGVLLGLIGAAYVHRGRGNASAQ